MTDRRLPAATPAGQVLVALALALLMATTRGQHVASIDALPSASWAVFFLAGALLASRWAPLGFIALATLLDLRGFSVGALAATCLTPAYWTLVPAYAALWLGGRFYARIHRDAFETLPRLAAMLVASAVVAYVFAKGGYYVLSGDVAQPSLSGFLARVPHAFPPALGALAGYAALGIGLRLASRRRTTALREAIAG